MRPPVHEREIGPSMGLISSPWDNAATLGLFGHIESVRNCARAHTALGD